MVSYFLILSAAGFVISFYTFTVEQKLKYLPGYKPVCDLSDWVSCTKPMKSQYSNIFLISNALLGMLYYALVAILAFLGATNLLLISTLLAWVVSCSLAYFLYIKIKALCLLCTTLYAINTVLLFMAIYLVKG